MQYRRLGGTGVEVSTLCLGTMMFGAWGNRDEQECHRIVGAALDAGVNLVDTADVYAHGESEEILGRALRGRRDDVVLATKFHEPMGDDRNRRGNSRRWIRRAVEESLRRLGTDRIDIYQVHRPDPRTDLDETLGALTDLVRQGKVVSIGTSAFPAEEIVTAQWVAERRHRERFTTEQLAYSILTRGAEAAALPTCARHRLGVLVFSPLNGGWLTGKYRSAQVPADSRAGRNGDHFDFRDAAARARKLDLVGELAAVAREAGLTLIELALGFVLSHPAVTSAIIGPRTLEQLRSQLSAGELGALPADLLDRVDALVPPGHDVNPADAGYRPPALTDPALRRRR
ncbi:aldo/keto reductase [Micromonospora endophytica]|uniref:Aldo/keto reductase n=1 Tax=Micromonospora endophytica TaxID=515350 RepID=A0A2W2BH63_9ACTN|nr:aldo/keto reductase [Micromonospora endophytica]PZF86831.1 aldo/keto reductase [Micromonospora endophytica]RIW43854.1 aldo/keto reductase [Micromonospora endophytica]BCJ56975.1 aldo/keto reductase [Micromonospora endophytica]